MLKRKEGDKWNVQTNAQNDKVDQPDVERGKNGVRKNRQNQRPIL